MKGPGCPVAPQPAPGPIWPRFGVMTCADAAGSFCGELLFLDPFYRWRYQTGVAGRGDWGLSAQIMQEVPEAGKEKKGREPTTRRRLSSHAGKSSWETWGSKGTAANTLSA